MNRIVKLILALTSALFILVHSVAPDSSAAVALEALTSMWPESRTSAEEPVELIEMLPDSTLLAVEVRGLEQRWPEIRALPAIRGFQDHVLAEIGLSPEGLLRLAGERAVLALVVSEDKRSVMPLALLRPDSLGDAEAVLRDATPGGIALTTRRGGGALWVGQSDRAARLDALAARANRRSFRSPMAEQIRQRPVASALVRGWLQPEALRALLSNRVEGADALPIDIYLSSATAALEAVRFMEFTRDVTPGGVVTDVVIEVDPARLPAEVAQVFVSAPDAWPVLPAPLPPGVVLASSFRTEAEAQWAWLRHVAAGDPRGPLRNFNFWTDEFQARYERDLERDLVEALGERGWLFLLEGETSETVQAVFVLETRDPARVEATLLALRSWLAEQAPARTLGLVAPRAHERRLNQFEVHGLAFWTPLAELPGPAFLVTDDHLVLGTGHAALDAGLSLLQTLETWAPTRAAVNAGTQPPHESLRLSGPTLSRWIEAAARPHNAGGSGSLSAWLDLLDDLEGVAVDVRYEDDAIRIASEVRFN